MLRGRCAAADTSQDDAIAADIAALALRVVEAEHEHGRFGLRARQHLDRHLGHRRERAERARQQLAEIVAGDVLHHAAAGLEGLGAARHRREAEEMIARGAGLDPPRARQIRRERAAERAGVGRPAEDRAVVHRLEGELLAFALDQRLDLGERRAGLGRQHQFLRLVQRHAAQARQIERQIGLARAAERALGAAARRPRASCPRPKPSARRLRRPWRPGLSARRSCQALLCNGWRRCHSTAEGLGFVLPKRILRIRFGKRSSGSFRQNAVLARDGGDCFVALRAPRNDSLWRFTTTYPPSLRANGSGLGRPDARSAKLSGSSFATTPASILPL